MYFPRVGFGMWRCSSSRLRTTFVAQINVYICCEWLLHYWRNGLWKIKICVMFGKITYKHRKALRQNEFIPCPKLAQSLICCTPYTLIDQTGEANSHYVSTLTSDGRISLEEMIQPLVLNSSALLLRKCAVISERKYLNRRSTWDLCLLVV